MQLEPAPIINMVDQTELDSQLTGGQRSKYGSDAPVMHANGCCVRSVQRVNAVKVQTGRKGELRVVSESDAQAEQFTKRLTIGGKVKGIFILVGMAAPVTSSVIAHEAMHAWFWLNGFRGSKQLGLQIEEGMCQLMAHLFLTQRPFRVCMAFT